MIRWRWVGQGVLAGLLLWFVGGALATQWESFRATPLPLVLRPGWLALSVLLAVATFGLLIQSWRVALAGWRQSLGWRDLAETWFVANLGRYLPGKVWSVAGMIVLAHRRGVETWAATAGAVAIQAIGLGTAVAVVAATLPGTESAVRLGLAALVAGGTLAVISWPPATAVVRERVPRLSDLRPLPPAALAGCAALTVAGWVGYGASFWALSRALGHPPVLSLATATGVFTLGYTVGLLALFAPGGAVVREAVLVALLAPVLGAAPALALSLASRLVLTVTELLAAAPFLVTYARSASRAAG